MTLEEYFRKQTITVNGTVYPAIDHALRVTVADGIVHFYIHPANTGGDTVDFEVQGNTLLTYKP